MKFAVAALLLSGASAFAPRQAAPVSTALFNGPVLGAGGMADTRDPDAVQHDDPRKSIGEAPSFEEYLKSRSGGAAAAPAPAPAAPVAAAPAPAYTPPAPAYTPPAPAYAPPPAAAPSGPVIGAGGMADTRDPNAMVHDDPRKSIGVAPSFEEYLKQRQAEMGGAAPAAAAPAPAAPAPVAAAPAYSAPAPVSAAPAGAGGSVVDTLASLQGPGQVWGADGIAVGKEESDLKGYENFGKFYEALQSTGLAAELAGAGPFTIFAPTDPALELYEMMNGPIDASVLKMHIVPGKISSAEIPNAQLTTIGGTPLTYRYAVRKHFVNDAIIGEKTFGPYEDFPIDVECSNGVIHAVSLCFAM